MINYLKLVRYQNLILIALTQIIFRYGFLKYKGLPLALTDFQFALLVLATVFIAAAGYVINDIYDVETDEINKPNQVYITQTISEKNANILYITLTSIGVILGFYIANVIDKPSFAVLFILTSFLLYLYTTTLKSIPFLGNIVVSLLVAFSILIIGVFDIYPIIAYNPSEMRSYFSILLDFAAFAFMVNFVREIVKDAQDYEGDFQNDIKTIPVAFGKKTANSIAQILLLVTLFFIGKYAYQYLMENSLYTATLYMLITVIAPLIYVLVQLFSAKESSNYKHLSLILKFVLFFGIFSIVIITYTSIHK